MQDIDRILIEEDCTQWFEDETEKRSELKAIASSERMAQSELEMELK